MNTNELTQNTKTAAYYLWNATRYDSPLNHWLCAEDIACEFETMGVTSVDNVKAIISKGVYDLGYVEFVRKVAYMLYIYANNDDDLANWYLAERLISNGEWITAVTNIASIYRENKGDSELVPSLRSEAVQQHYRKSIN